MIYLKSSDYRKGARESLKNKWLRCAGITLMYFLIIYILGFIQGILPLRFQFLISILTIIIGIPLCFGLTASLFNISNNKEDNIFSFLTIGFNNFGKAWSIFFHTLLKMIIPIIMIFGSLIIASICLSLFAVSLATGVSMIFTIFSLLLALICLGIYVAGLILLIVKSYSYPFSYIIAVESPELTSKEVLDKSELLMKNKRAKLFVLQLSFIGWAILSFFTLGLGFLWLLPYILFSTFVFYKNVKEEKLSEKPKED